MALDRHAGQWVERFTADGVRRYIEGKDLTAIQRVIGTGGALTRLPHGRQILEALIRAPRGKKLLPPPEAEICIDQDYIMASLGVLCKTHPEAALKLLLHSLGLGD